MTRLASLIAGQEIQVLRRTEAQVRANGYARADHQVMAEMPKLRQAAHALEDLDVSLGFGRLALEMQHVRPVMDDSCASEGPAYP